MNVKELKWHIRNGLIRPDYFKIPMHTSVQPEPTVKNIRFVICKIDNPIPQMEWTSTYYVEKDTYETTQINSRFVDTVQGTVDRETTDPLVLNDSIITPNEKFNRNVSKIFVCKIYENNVYKGYFTYVTAELVCTSYREYYVTSVVGEYPVSSRSKYYEWDEHVYPYSAGIAESVSKYSGSGDWSIADRYFGCDPVMQIIPDRYSQYNGFVNFNYYDLSQTTSGCAFVKKIFGYVIYDDSVYAFPNQCEARTTVSITSAGSYNGYGYPAIRANLNLSTTQEYKPNSNGHDDGYYDSELRRTMYNHADFIGHTYTYNSTSAVVFRMMNNSSTTAADVFPDFSERVFHFETEDIPGAYESVYGKVISNSVSGLGTYIYYGDGLTKQKCSEYQQMFYDGSGTGGGTITVTYEN